MNVLLQKKRKRSLPGTIIKAGVGVIVLWLVIVAAFPFFEHWVWLKFFLICALGLGFLGITYILRTC